MTTFCFKTGRDMSEIFTPPHPMLPGIATILPNYTVVKPHAGIVLLKLVAQRGSGQSKGFLSEACSTQHSKLFLVLVYLDEKMMYSFSLITLFFRFAVLLNKRILKCKSGSLPFWSLVCRGIVCHCGILVLGYLFFLLWTMKYLSWRRNWNACGISKEVMKAKN